jgi:hypothetical protein
MGPTKSTTHALWEHAKPKSDPKNPWQSLHIRLLTMKASTLQGNTLTNPNRPHQSPHQQTKRHRAMPILPALHHEEVLLTGLCKALPLALACSPYFLEVSEPFPAAFAPAAYTAKQL